MPVSVKMPFWNIEVHFVGVLTEEIILCVRHCLCKKAADAGAIAAYGVHDAVCEASGITMCAARAEMGLNLFLIDAVNGERILTTQGEESARAEIRELLLKMLKIY